MEFLLLLIMLGGLAYLLAALRPLQDRVRRLEGEIASLRMRTGEQSQRVIAAKAGISGQEVTAGRAETPGFAGVTDSGPGGVAEPEPADNTFATLFERLVGGRLLIWIGGIALAVGGVFLVRYSIELVTPEARMIAAAALGLLLIGAGDYARGGRLLAHEPRIGQALVGAGIAVLYATAYGSHIMFGLIGTGTAAALMVLITAAALGLSLRHGAPTAAMGLVGGFLTPLLVGARDAGAWPVLAYLTLLDVAIFGIAWKRGWNWLVAAALAGSFAWSFYLVLEGPQDALAAGLFAAVLGIVAGLAGRGGRGAMQAAAMGLALLELSIVAGRSDVGAAGWLLFGMLSVASVILAWIRNEHRSTPSVALGLALILIAAKAGAGDDPLLPLAAVVTTLLFAGAAPLLQMRQRTLAVLNGCAALAGPLLILRALRSDLLAAAAWGGIALLLGAAALALMWLQRRSRAAGGDAGAYAAGGTAALLFAVGAYDLAPRDLVSGAWLAAAVVLLLAGVRIGDKALRVAGLGLLTATVLKVFLVDAAALEGVLRILSFLALGVALIGIGILYGKVLAAPKCPAARPET